MGSYLGYFLRPHMLVLAAVFLGAAAAGTWWLRGRLPGRVRKVLFFLLVVSVGLVLMVTLLREPPLGTCWGCLTDWGLGKIIEGRVGTDVGLNIALFVPPVFLATLLLRAPWRITGVAALVSIAIEIIQPLIGVGVNDAIDVLANSVGALIGAGAATALLLIRDAIATRRLDVGRTIKLAVSLAAGAAVLLGGPAWTATAKQGVAAARLEQMFAGTALADYQRDGATTWEPKLNGFWTDIGQPTAMSYSTDTVARQRYSWDVYFAVRCVVAEWTPTGFTVIRLSGNDCTDPFHP